MSEEFKINPDTTKADENLDSGLAALGKNKQDKSNKQEDQMDESLVLMRNDNEHYDEVQAKKEKEKKRAGKNENKNTEDKAKKATEDLKSAVTDAGDFLKNGNGESELKKSEPQIKEEELKIALKATQAAYERVFNKNSEKAKKLKERMDIETNSLKKEQDRMKNDPIGDFQEEIKKQKREEREKDQKSKAKEAEDISGVNDEEVYSSWIEKSKEKKDEKTESKRQEGNKNENEKTESKERKNNKQEGNAKEKETGSAEELKNKADELFKNVFRQQEKVQKLKNDMGKISKAMNILGIGKDSENEDNPVRKLREAEKALEMSKLQYREKYQEFANQIVADKKSSLEQEDIVEDGGKGELKKFILSERIVSGTEKNEKGEIEKFTLFEYMNRNEKKLLEKREGVLSEKKKGTFSKAMKWYGKRSKVEKFVISVALSASIGAGATLAFGGGLVAATSCFGAQALSSKIRSKLLRMVGIGAVVGAGAGALKWDREQLKAKNKNKAQENVVENLKTQEGNIFEALDRYNKQIKEKERNNKILIGALALSTSALFGTLDLHEVEAENVILTDPGGSGIDIKPIAGTTKDHIDGQDALDEIAKTSTRPEALASQKMYAGLNKDSLEHYSQKAHARGMYESVKDFTDQQEKLLNHSFNLKSGGNVWNSLSEHFDGNRQEVGKALAGFKEETIKNLTERGMTETQADKFIDWRYRHMNVGTDFNLNNGKLEISGFVDDSQLENFKNHNPGIMMDNVDKEILEQAEQDIKDRSISGRAEADTFNIDNKINLDNKVTQAVNENVAKIYESLGKDQTYEWNVMKDKPAWDIIEGKYGDPIGIDSKEIDLSKLPEAERGSLINNGLDQAEINNREQLKEYLLRLSKETGLSPKNSTFTTPGETVETFIKRAEASKLS